MSRLCKLTIAGIVLFLAISLILSLTNVVLPLDFLYYCSYVKLFITLVKYVPQAYLNYRRKSTHGWSIGNIILDFTGGILSIGQMFVLAFNESKGKMAFFSGSSLFSLHFRRLGLNFRRSNQVWPRSLFCDV